MEAQRCTPCLTGDQLHALKTADHAAWDKLTDDGKHTIIGHDAHNPRGPSPIGPPPRPPPRCVNLTDFTPDEHAYFVAQLHKIREGSYPSDDAENPPDMHFNAKEITNDCKDEPPSDNTDQLYAYMTCKQNNARKQPGVDTRLMSKSLAKKS